MDVASVIDQLMLSEYEATQRRALAEVLEELQESDIMRAMPGSEFLHPRKGALLDMIETVKCSIMTAILMRLTLLTGFP